MKIAIIGSGAIGCLFGAYLSKNNEVHMICRRQKVADTINIEGLTIFEPDEPTGHYTDVTAHLSGQYTDNVDLVMIVVKGADTDEAIRVNKSLFQEHTMVMTLQNGGGNDLKLSQYVPMERIIVATTRINAVNLDNGNVRHSGYGITHMGSNIKGTDLKRFADAFNEAGFETIISDDIQHIIWNKLFVNLSINTFTSITKAKIGSMIDNEYAWNYAEKMICEAIDVAEAEGHHFSYREVLNSIHKTCEDVAGGFPSMLQDIMNCRRTEVDAINGYVVDRARAHNVPAPYNTFVRNLIHAIESTYKEQVRPQIKYKEGDVIVRQGEVSSTLYKVMQGNVSLYLNYEEENEYLICVYGIGKCFGEYSYFSGKLNPYSVVANEDTIVMEIPKNEFHQFISINPKNAEEIFASMAQQLALVSKHIEMVTGDDNQ
jgi:2-dehydropantoate 2-reductase